MTGFVLVFFFWSKTKQNSAKQRMIVGGIERCTQLHHFSDRKQCMYINFKMTDF